ncbi:hypothetical protein [Roseobacter sp.]
MDSDASASDYTFFVNDVEVSGTPSLAIDDTVYAQRAVGDQVYQTNTVAVVAPAVPEASSATPAITIGGTTASLTLSAAADWGFYAGGGHVWIVRASGMTVDDATPAVATGTTSGSDTEDASDNAIVDGTSFTYNGMCADLPFNCDAQGLDELQSYHNANFKKGFATPWDAALNLTLPHSVDAETTLTKRVRLTSATSKPANNYGHDFNFHFVDRAPPAGSFPPASFSSNKRPMVALGMLDKTALGSGFAVPSSGLDLATVTAGEYMDEFVPYWTGFGEAMRGATYNTQTSDGYTGNISRIGQRRGQYLAAMLYEGSSISDTDLAFGVREGFNLLRLAASEEADIARNGAGQAVMWAGMARVSYHLCENAFLRRQADRVVGSWGLQITGWAEDEDIAAGIISWTGDESDHRAETVQSGHTGLPLWSQEGNRNSLDMNSFARYREVAGPASLFEWSIIACLQNGPDGMDGIATATYQDDFASWGADNDLAAIPAYMDVYREFNPNIDIGSIAFHAPQNTALYDASRSTWSAPLFSGKGYPVTPQENWGAYLSATVGVDGSIDIDVTDLPSMSQAALEWDVRYSMDGRHFFPVSFTGPAGTQSGLAPGQRVFVRYRVRSMSGWTAWSVNFTSWTAGGGDAESKLRMWTTTTGAVPATSNTSPPAILVPTIPSWDGRSIIGGLFEDAAGSYDANTTLFIAGEGLWQGDLTGDATIEWRKDGVAIAGETDVAYSREDPAAFDMTVAITRDGITVVSPAISLAAVPTPAGAVIDTDMGTLFPLDHSSIFQSMEASFTHEPHKTFSNSTATTGWLRAARLAGDNTDSSAMQIPTVNGTEYRVTGNLRIEELNPDNWVTAQIRIGLSRFEHEYALAVITAPTEEPIDYHLDFTFTATSDTAYITLYYGTGSGTGEDAFGITDLNLVET